MTRALSSYPTCTVVELKLVHLLLEALLERKVVPLPVKQPPNLPLRLKIPMLIKTNSSRRKKQKKRKRRSLKKEKH